MTDYREQFRDISFNIQHSTLSEIYNYFTQFNYREGRKLLYYNTYLYRDRDYFYITYHGNKILTYTSDSLTFHNTYYYGHPSTSKRVNRLIPRNLIISRDRGYLSGIGLAVELKKVLTISPNGEVQYIRPLNVAYDFCTMQVRPLWEGLKLTQSLHHDEYEIEYTKQWFDSYSLREDKALFKEIYLELLEESIRRGTSLNLYINTNTYDRSNVLVYKISDDSSRKLPKLTSDFKHKVNEILKATGLSSSEDNVISMKINCNSLSSIDKTKELMKLM